MKKLMKILTVLVIFMVLVAQFALGSIVETAINTFGPDMMGVGVSVENVSISPLTGDAKITNLVVQNPEGFSDNAIFTLGEVVVDMDMLSLFGPTIRIPQMTINAPTIRYERAVGGTNIGHLQKSMSAGSGSGSTSASSPSGSSPVSEASSKQVEIDLVLIESGQVTLAVSGIGANVPLPTVKITDIGKGGGDTSFVGAIKKIMGALVGAISQLKAAGVLDGTSDAVKNVRDTLKSFF